MKARPSTAARTMEVLRRCPLAIAQRLVHCAIAVSTAVLGQSHKDNVRCTAVEEQPEAEEVQLSQPSCTSLCSGLTLGSSSNPAALDLAWNSVVMTHAGVCVCPCVCNATRNMTQLNIVNVTLTTLPGAFQMQEAHI